MASIRETSAGTFAVIWRSPDHGRKCRAGCTKTSHQHARSFPVRWQAEQFAATAEADELASKRLGRTVAPKTERQTTPDFRSAAIDLIERGGPRKTWNVRTQRMYRSVLSTQLGVLYGRSVAEVAADRELAEKIAETATRPAHALCLMRAVCRHAVNCGQINSHRLDDIDVRQPRGHRDIIPATSAQLAVIAGTLDAWRPGLGLSVHLAAGCGLRPAETLAVESGDFRESYRTLRVRRQVQDGQPCPLKAKREGAYRDVPVPASVAEKVAQHVTERGQGPLFRGPRGGFVPAGKYGYRFRKGAAAAGLPAKFTPHQLRHGFATKLLTAGVPITDVAKFMGHSTTAMTETYSHLLPSSFDRARAVLDAA